MKHKRFGQGSLGMSDKSGNGKPNGAINGAPEQKKSDKVLPEAMKAAEVAAAAAAAPSAAQGLQSVMAVIGDTYDPAVSGAVDKAVRKTGNVLAGSGSKLTDKIDAARLEQSGNSSVSQGLQSIMAVIGEEYEDDKPEASDPSGTAALPEVNASKGTSVADSKPTVVAEKDSDNPEAKSAISELLPMLTADEENIGHSHTQVVSSEASAAKLPSVAATVAAVPRGAEMRTLLGQLKADISTLETGSAMSLRQQFNMPAAIDSASSEMQTLLAQLQGDISALRNENEGLKTQYKMPTVMGGAGHRNQFTTRSVAR